MSRSSPTISRLLGTLLLCPVLSAATTPPPNTADTDLSKYPLRLQVLAASSNTRIPTRFQGVAGGASPGDADLSASMSSAAGSLAQGSTFGDQDPVFYGTGRADLFSSAGTQGLSFRYADCTDRVHVGLSRQPLAARWKLPGKQLEVLVPTDTAPVKGRPVRADKCLFTVTLRNTVYLRLGNGTVVQVSQQDFARKPALRRFVQGVTPTLQPRTSTSALPPATRSTPAPASPAAKN